MLCKYSDNLLPLCETKRLMKTCHYNAPACRFLPIEGDESVLVTASNEGYNVTHTNPFGSSSNNSSYDEDEEDF